MKTLSNPIGARPAGSGWCVLAAGVYLATGLLASGADTVLGSKHDLSLAGPGPIKALTESEVCVFCHTPHNAVGELPLWNHALSKATYTPYQSSTTKARIGQPTGASRLCLSCHDGTVALGMVNSRSQGIVMRDQVVKLPSGPSNLGTDLSGEHPISFVYDNVLAGANGQLKDPVTLKEKVRLDHNKEVQCTSCHNPHDNQYGKFLVQGNYGSTLCVNCHDQRFWLESSHRNSSKTWKGSGVNPWPRAKYNTVSGNACENCHAVHGAASKPRLLKFADEKTTCYSCHSGTVAEKDIQAEFNKFSAHPILRTTGLHDPMEDPVNAPRHSECSDCHNPHASRGTAAAAAPTASGALQGVKGVNAAGMPVSAVSYEYELCFRCHADSVNRGPARVNRQFIQSNKRLAFQASNPSFHPIETVGRNPSVPSLIPPWSTGSRMYCTDCHNNDQGPGAGGAGPNGPHGSIYQPLLERQLLVTDQNPESAVTYALCYKCHSRDSLLSDQSFHALNALGQDRGHRFHIVDQRTACTTCHDSHGVERQAKLINFNRDYVNQGSNGRLEYNSTGLYQGNCSLSCHGKDHAATRYGP